MNIETNLKTLIIQTPLKLECGQTIKAFPIASETYGSQNSQKDHASFIFNSLPDDQYLTCTNTITHKYM